MKSLLSASLALLAVATPAAAQLSDAEQVMVRTVESRLEDDVALLERLVVQNSGTHNHQGVRAVADMLAPELAALGFVPRWIDQSHVGRAGHLFALHEGDPAGPRMLLIGHMDTVFEPTSPFQGFSRDGMIATGPGVEDDKGGVVIMLAALRAMQAAGTLDRANIMVALIGDEEDVGMPIADARADLLMAGEWADITLGFEGLSVIDGRDWGVTSRRSGNTWVVRVEAESGHSSQIFQPGSSTGAIYELARILDAFRTQLPEENLTFNVGLAAGGTPAVLAEDGLSASTAGKTNIIPDSAVARGDLRAISVEQTDRVVAAMEAIVAQSLPGTRATLEFIRRYPPMAPTDGNAALLERLNAVNADLGLARQEPVPPIMRGGADTSFVAALSDTIDGLGAHGQGAHAPGETADLSTFTRQTQRAAILMSRLAAEQVTRAQQ